MRDLHKGNGSWRRANGWRHSWSRAFAGFLLLGLPSLGATVAVSSLMASPAGATNVWSAPQNIDVFGGLKGVSCASPSFCVAVDNSADVMTFNGSSWSPPVNIDSAVLTAVSCTSASFCVAVDIAGDALTFNGATWSSPTGIDAVALTDVSCASSSFCVAVDTSGNALYFNGSTWPSYSPLGSYSSAVSCTDPVALRCVVLDDGANAYTTSFAAPPFWSAPSSVSSLLVDVSCGSSSFCIATNQFGDASFFNGSTWSSPGLVGGPLIGVSCVSASFCAAVDNLGEAFTFNGASWSSAAQIDGYANSLLDVSCATSSFCVAVDNAGNAMLYQPCGFSILTPSPLPSATHGASYSTTLTGCAGTPPYKFKKVGKLPKGLKLFSNGVIMGVPATAGNYSFGVKLTDKAKPKHTTTKTFSITVS